MKKSELTQLTQVIEHLVTREVRKQLPTLIAEAFQNMMGKSIVMEKQQPIAVPLTEEVIEEAGVDDFKMSMKKLFAGVTPTEHASIQGGTHTIKHYTKDPKINAILNETVSDLKQRERMVGGAALMAGYSPSMAGTEPMTNDGEISPLARNLPSMSNISSNAASGRVVVSEGIPAAAIPEGVSALDVARQIPLAKPVAQALTKNYSAMMKLIDSKRKKI